MAKNSKKIFISGIAGFIGFHLALALKRRGDEVCGLDNFNSYYSPELKRARSHLLEKEGIEVFDKDVCNTAFLEKEIEDKQISHFAHLAAQAGVRHSFTHPEDYIHSNLEGFTSVLEALKNRPHIKLIYASSSSVYGTNTKTPFSEGDRTDSPANLYGATKKSNEVMATSYHNLFGLSVTGLRYFTVYGPWGRPDMAYSLFTNLILQKKPIKVFGNGKMKRDFTYIDDIVDGTMSAIDLGAQNEIFNLGNNTRVEVLTMIEYLEDHLEMKAEKVLIPYSKGEAFETYADISKAQNILGFSPKTKLKDGLESFLDWHQEYASTKDPMLPVDQ